MSVRFVAADAILDLITNVGIEEPRAGKAGNIAIQLV